jgi:maltose O-acetyltransferase
MDISIQVHCQPHFKYLSRSDGITNIGDYVYMNWMCTILDNNAVHIGHHVMIGPGVQIYTAAHPLQVKPRIQGWEATKAIMIEDNDRG